MEKQVSDLIKGVATELHNWGPADMVSSGPYLLCNSYIFSKGLGPVITTFCEQINELATTSGRTPWIEGVIMNFDRENSSATVIYRREPDGRDHTTLNDMLIAGLASIFKCFQHEIATLIVKS